MTIQTSRTVVGLAVIAILVLLFWYVKRDAGSIGIMTFESCVDAGYKVTGDPPVRCVTPDGRTFVSATSTATTITATTSATSTATSTGGVSSFPTDNSDRIRVSTVSANQKVGSPLTIKGEARGSWYFEASFPAELIDGNGKRIAQVPAQALGDWMTSDFVPFSVTLSFAKPSTATGTLIFHNDNPSGQPENNRSISIPVRF